MRDPAVRAEALDGVDVIVHTAALHAPHVGLYADIEFESINVELSRTLMEEGVRRGIEHFVFTSTTALYGHASTPEDRAGWVDESVEPRPKTIYHRTKLAAERALRALSEESGVPVTVLRMSRCFPERADLMAVYRLNRGVDARDVAEAHALAVERRLPGFRCFNISATPAFDPACCERLHGDAAALIRKRAPMLAAEFDRRGWTLPSTLDRVYDSSAAGRELGWVSRHGFESVLRMLDDECPEVLPVIRGR